jgi:hypothetical protein
MIFPLHLPDYVKIYDNFFDDEFCSTTVDKLKNINWKTHEYFTPDHTYVNYEDDLKISYEVFKEKEIITNSVKLIIEKYIFFDMPQEFSWFKSYQGYSDIRFNRYDKNTQMRPHCDHIHDLFDGERKGIPILSIVGSLNDDYTGGDFIMWGNQKIDIPAGTIIVFPSNFMYPHCVTPITNGTRYSFVSWVW